MGGSLRHRLIRLVAAFGLLATVACGARLSNAQYVEARGAGTGGGGTGTNRTATGSGSSTASGAAATPG
ncbi:MAG: hypothetical protein QOH79_639, partial [Acidimicrobiaceae bacterium]